MHGQCGCEMFRLTSRRRRRRRRVEPRDDCSTTGDLSTLSQRSAAREDPTPTLSNRHNVQELTQSCELVDTYVLVNVEEFCV